MNKGFYGLPAVTGTKDGEENSWSNFVTLHDVYTSRTGEKLPTKRTRLNEAGDYTVTIGGEAKSILNMSTSIPTITISSESTEEHEWDPDNEMSTDTGSSEYMEVDSEDVRFFEESFLQHLLDEDDFIYFDVRSSTDDEMHDAMDVDVAE